MNKSICNYFINRGIEAFEPINALKLNKLVYLANCWHITLAARPLFDEMAEAWVYGPIIPSVYADFKKFGRNPIDMIFSAAPKLEENTLEFLGQIWDRFGGLTDI